MSALDADEMDYAAHREATINTLYQIQSELKILIDLLARDPYLVLPETLAHSLIYFRHTALNRMPSLRRH